MKRINVFVLGVLLMSASAPEIQAQGFLQRIGRIAKEAAESKIGQKVENAVNSSIDKATSIKKKGKKNSDSESYDSDEQEEEVTVSSSQPQKPQKLSQTYSKSDFVPGDQIIFEDPVEGEQPGEFPSKWDLIDGNAEVVNVGGQQAILLPGDVNICPLMKDNSDNYLGDVYTIEYDILYDISESYLWMGLFVLNPRSEGKDEQYNISYGSDATDYNAHYHRTTGENGDANGNLGYQITDNKWHHLALSFNKRAIKFYVDGQRVVNVPNAKSNSGWFYFHKDNDGKAFIKNIRVAKGAVPLYDRLATEGKIITYAITFETAKADIKPESYSEINRIAKLMQDNPNISFEVQGHCDSSGSDQVNDPLSQKRAEAIVAALIDQGIAKSRLTAVGKGSHEPIADNNSDEGRAKNRRVEFVKK